MQGQRRPQEGSTQGVQPTEKMTPNTAAWKKPMSLGIHLMAAAPEQFQPEHPQKVEAKKDHHQPRHQVDGGLVFPQETAHRPGQGSQGHETPG